jgi:hypothetical protein
VTAYTLVLKNADKKCPVPEIMQISDTSPPYLSGTTTLSQFMPTAYMAKVDMTVRDLHYAEIAATGSYANYNYYLLGFTQVGFIPNIDPITDLYLDVLNDSTDYSGDLTKYPKFSEYRSKIIPNAYGEIYNDASKEFLDLMVERPIGPYKYDIAVDTSKW